MKKIREKCRCREEIRDMPDDGWYSCGFLRCVKCHGVVLREIVEDKTTPTPDRERIEPPLKRAEVAGIADNCIRLHEREHHKPPRRVKQTEFKPNFAQSLILSDFIEKNKGKEIVVDGNTIRAVEPTPTIEQELEAGLYQVGDHWCVSATEGVDRCTRIFLPFDKWRELIRHVNEKAGERVIHAGTVKDFKWRDILIFSTNDTQITYCTD